MKTYHQFVEDSGILKQYENEAKERKTKTYQQKIIDKDLNKLTYMLNRDLPPN
jgi:hypothetical protein